VRAASSSTASRMQGTIVIRWQEKNLRCAFFGTLVVGAASDVVCEAPHLVAVGRALLPQKDKRDGRAAWIRHRCCRKWTILHLP
jgi:hypothetical protein